MAKKLTAWKTKGMNQDLSVSAFNHEFAFENMNLRLSTNEGNTLMSLVNERGTASIDIINSEAKLQSTLQIEGTPIGTAVLNHQLVIFTTGDDDKIYVLKYNSDKTALLGKLLYHGDLHFDTDYPIETLVSYESEMIQKVYWTDNLNQPRMINIASENIRNNVDTQFDFISELQLNETVTVQKQLGATGMFAPGVIQYAFTYYKKYGQESNIFYTTPLHYISYKDRGASPEDKVENAFKITVENVDTNFDYLRIYSIQRTSINGTPIVKRIQDIEINDKLDPVDPSDLNKGYKASYLDTGFSGNTVDPTELLYKGGDTIIAKTMEQKDGTLFLGSLQTRRGEKEDILREYIKSKKNPDDIVTFTSGCRLIRPSYQYEGFYKYGNQLTAYEVKIDTKITDIIYTDFSVPCAGFKKGDYYRLGIQFQYKTGKWSDPFFIKDEIVTTTPGFYKAGGIVYDDIIQLPIIQGSLKQDIVEKAIEAGYIKVRAVVVYPEMQDRIVICQGVVNPTLYTENQRGTVSSSLTKSNRSGNDNAQDIVFDDTTGELDGGDTGSGSTTNDGATGDLYAQSSWFFRPHISSTFVNEDNMTVSPKAGTEAYLEYTNRSIESGNYDASNIRQVEVQGDFKDTNKFIIDENTVTFHSPDIEFDDRLSLMNFIDLNYKQVGSATFEKTVSDIDIQTETPTVSDKGSGFVHKSFSMDKTYGIVSGLFYDDVIVDDNVNNSGQMRAYPEFKASAKWMVYPWQGTGSLNNDINRPADQGTATAVLKKKVLSNLRVAKTELIDSDKSNSFVNPPQLFSSDEVSILKLKEGFYKGNINTLLVPDNSDGVYFANEGADYKYSINPSKAGQKFSTKQTPFTSKKWMKTFAPVDDNNNDRNGIYTYIWYNENTIQYGWHLLEEKAVGETFRDLVTKKLSVRMKYKSAPHLVLTRNTSETSSITWGDYSLPILELVRDYGSIKDTIFGGQSQDALRENTWIPCGEPVRLDSPLVEGKLPFEYSYGDTYFQRWDCLKTYAFTPEDINQVVEIGSFMLETRTNIDGRYDRNRAQSNNLNMSPRNFNLLNPVYSQLNNFFSYKIMDEDSYKDNFYPNQITWTKIKNAGADVDQWTNITMASVLELDGDKGEVNKLVRFNNFLFAFQDTGISQIMYNDNVQVQSTQGVPIEIANSGKVQGKDYKSDTVGCSNKWSVVTTPNGVYFMDSNDKSIYLFNGQLQNLSAAFGFNAWCKRWIPSSRVEWEPVDFGSAGKDYLSNFVAYFDRKNQDVLFINDDKALAYSEKFQTFTSFYDYGKVPYFCNLDDTGIWLKPYTPELVFSKADIGEVVPTVTQLWQHQAGDYCSFFGTNKAYWMTLVGNPEPQMDKIFTNLEFRASVEDDGEPMQEASLFNFTLPFDSLETWNEYQHGIAHLQQRDGHSQFKHHDKNGEASLKRRFRIWRCDIPRDNAILALDEGMDISRTARHPNDRMRNPWLYLKLTKKAASGTHIVDEIEVPNVQAKAEIHDIVMTYFV